uniref:Toxin candidate TRINITY_DN33830_c0_g1_i1.p1 n=1 Tax=Pachycerianthus maua TaxID=2736681 RepID=A0A7G7WYX5_9CNID|nr:toxin candidate TRINITY_DN33830_c0_g1_i1.p1 [Pachycerianthus maua]
MKFLIILAIVLLAVSPAVFAEKNQEQRGVSVNTKQKRSLSRSLNSLDGGWVYRSGYCYFFSTTTVLSWYEARKECYKLGSDLASIHSPEEQAFIMNWERKISNAFNGKKPIWIGGNDIKTEGTFEWDDDSYYCYTNWYTGEPNNSGGIEDCVDILYSYKYSGQWNDMSCTATNHRYVCKKSC